MGRESSRAGVHIDQTDHDWVRTSLNVTIAQSNRGQLAWINSFRFDRQLIGLLHDANLTGTIRVNFRGVVVKSDGTDHTDFLALPGLRWWVEVGQVVAPDDDRVGLIRIGMSQVYECGVPVAMLIVVDAGDDAADFIALLCDLAVFFHISLVGVPSPAGVVDHNQKGQKNSSTDN